MYIVDNFLPRIPDHNLQEALDLTPILSEDEAIKSEEKVYSCGGYDDTCICGANNPYPCCANGGNCTWWAWHEMCCNWGYAAGGWGNANTWATNAAAAGHTVTSTPTVGSIAVDSLTQPYGHVVYVTGVSGSNITVREMNCCTGCHSGMRTNTYSASKFNAGYILPKNTFTPISVNGSALSGNVGAGAYRYYSFPVTASRFYMIELLPSSGNPDLYGHHSTSVSTSPDISQLGWPMILQPPI